MKDVLITQFQFGAFMAVTESGCMEVNYMSGVGYKELNREGLYRWDGEKFRYVEGCMDDPAVYAAVHADDDKLKDWLDECGFGWEEKGDAILPAKFGPLTYAPPFPGINEPPHVNNQAPAPESSTATAPAAPSGNMVTKTVSGFQIGVGASVLVNGNIHTCVKRELTDSSVGIKIYFRATDGKDIVTEDAEYQLVVQ